ncbi:Phenylalanyl-tRNA synthetase beta chain [hydrothermal vent metagenome]|uniref:Phenylalanine--tRNA ligase beta subunit n=1 Tax=hydrothermal vent metagenome TaxID=652676 RepID=A0A3B0V6L8_9ZZZZ
MKFTVNWLKQYVDFDLSVEDLAERLTMLGLEVDAVTPLYQALSKIKVAKVITVAQHPQADHLSLCTVQVGEEVKRVVCGAPNVRPGLLSAIALPGVVMPEGFKIKKSKLRGEVSEGMLCSEKELGLNDSHAGIIELPESCVAGQSLRQALNLEDTLIEVDLTPNRPDCTSVIGVAREIAAFSGSSLKLPEAAGNIPAAGSASFSVEVLDSILCPRYAAQLLRGVKIGPSPAWLQRLLTAVGLRPINNIVDITNFVMLEYGQPLHAFDFNKLSGGRIIVRRALNGEKITTLDEVERLLEPDMLVICDENKPAAVAGVMGGGGSEVDNSSCEILLESAYFNPVSIRRTARRLKLSTDASYRFERGIDPQGTIKALNRAISLMVRYGGAAPAGSMVDCQGTMPEIKPINFRVQRTSNLLGADFTLEEISTMLNAIEVTSTKVDEDTLLVTPPSFRVDLEREIDLVEEIARLKGYNEIPTTLPTVPMTFSSQAEDRLLRRQISRIMTGLGCSEAINYSFTDPADFDKLTLEENDHRRRTIKIMNPLSEEQSVMRTTLLPGLLENARHNINHQNNDLKLFEIGKVFLPVDGQQQPLEEQHLCAVFSGRRQLDGPPVHFGTPLFDIYDAKGIIENLLNEIRLEAHFTMDSEAPYSAPGLFLTIESAGKYLGELGKLSPTVLKAFGIKEEVYFLDLNLDNAGAAQIAGINFKPLSRFPAVKRDLAIIIDNGIGAGELADAINNEGFKHLQQVEIFDIYQGNPIKEGKKSVALSLTYHSDKNTLKDKAVAKIQNKIIALLVDKFHGKLREA